MWPSFYLCVLARCWLPGYRIHVSNDVGANICAVRFELTVRNHYHTLDDIDTTRVAARWTLRLTLYSRCNSVVWKLTTSRDSFGRCCRSALLRKWRLCRQQEKLSYCQGTVEPVVHPRFRLLYDFAKLHETLGHCFCAVKQTVHRIIVVAVGCAAAAAIARRSAAGICAACF